MIMKWKVDMTDNERRKGGIPRNFWFFPKNRQGKIPKNCLKLQFSNYADTNELS